MECLHRCIAVSVLFVAFAGGNGWAQESDEEKAMMTEWVSIDGRPPIEFEAPPRGLPYVATEVAPVAPLSKDKAAPVVFIVVEHVLYTQIGASLTAFQSTLAAEGYETYVIDFTSGTAEDLRAGLINAYEGSGYRLEGAILVGNLPHVIYEMMETNNDGDIVYATFPCDLFLMDMDDVWEDLLTDDKVQPNNGKYDTWTGNRKIEIWVSRLAVHMMPALGTASELATDYFARNIAYRTTVPSSATALSFTDDDWARRGASDEACLASVYGAEAITGYSDKLATSRDNYVMELGNAHQIVHVRSHGYPNGHTFDPGGWVESSDYIHIAPETRFYSLFVCSGCSYLYPNYLGGATILNPAAGGLLTWGSTKAGGMLGDQHFYTPVSEGACFGKAFAAWYNALPDDPHWRYGMVMAGDGTLRPDTRSNDWFELRREVSGDGGADSGNNRAASLQPGEPSHAIAAHGKSVWWSWTPYSSGKVYIDTFGSDFDTVMAVYTGLALNDLTLVARSDDSDGTRQSKVTFMATAGVTYKIAVAGKDNGSGPESGKIQLNRSLFIAPANDAYSSAIVLTGLSGDTTGDNRGATKQTGEPTHAGTGSGQSVWWAYQWNENTPLVITLDTVGSGFDTALAVYTGKAVSTLTQVVANDNIDSETLTSRVIFIAQPGVNYRIAVDGAGESNAGPIVLRWEGARTQAVDGFADKRTVGGMSGRSTGNTVGATKEVGEPNHAGNVGGKSIWWQFSPPTDQLGGEGTKITFSTAGSDFDTTLAVYQGATMATLVPVASNNDAHGTPQSEVSFNMNSQFYMIAVDGYRTGIVPPSGNVVLSWNVNDAFADRLTLWPASGGIQDGANDGATRETGEPLHGGGVPGARSVWFKWTAPTSASTLFSFQGYSSPIMSAYTGSTLASLQEVDYATHTGAQMRFCAEAGTQYQIAVDGVNSGSFQIQWQLDTSARHLSASISAGYGDVRVNGTSIGNSYEGDFDACEVVTLYAATTSPSWAFLSWTGDAQSDEPTIQVPMKKDMEIFAVYKRDKYTLSVDCYSPGDLYVDGAWSGSSYRSYKDIGSAVSLRAVPAPGYVFSRWYGDVASNEDEVDLVIDQSMHIKAEFLKENQAVLTPAQDATLYGDAEGDVANGAGEWLFVGESGDAPRRALLQFDVASALPQYAQVLSAELRMYDDSATSSALAVDLVKAETSWGEGASNAAGDESSGAPAQANDATWLHSAYDAAFWTTPGGDASGDLSASILINVPQAWYVWDRIDPSGADPLVVADVQTWLDHPEQNHGWFLLGDEDLGVVKRFASRQNANPDLAPQLAISYGTSYEEEVSYTRYSSEDVPITIPGMSTACSSIDMSESFIIADINVSVMLTCDYIDSVALYLESPEGDEVLLVENVSAAGDAFDLTQFNDEAIASIYAGKPPFTGQFRPASPLTAFDGENAQGEWRLCVVNVAGYPAYVTQWDLCFTAAPEDEPPYHSADTNQDWKVSATEISRVVGFYNAGGYCSNASTADGYAPGAGAQDGHTHDSDFNPANWVISAVELSRLVTFYNAGGYQTDAGTMDGFAPSLK